MTTPDAPSTIGVILAGGAGKRLGGDKSLREFGGRSLLSRAVERLQPQCHALLISANDTTGRFASFGCPVVPDTIAGQPGPLGGILAALDHIAQTGEAEWLFSAPVDCPFLPNDLVARLHAARGEAPIALASSNGRSHPVIALWHVSLRADLYHALAGEDVRKASAFIARHAHAMETWDTSEGDPFFNVNTPDDLAQAERMATAATA